MGRKGFGLHIQYSSGEFLHNPTLRKTEKELKAGKMEEHNLLAYWFVFSYISYTAQAHLPKTGAAHHGLRPLTSVINKDNFWKIPLEISSSQVTLGCINLRTGKEDQTKEILTPQAGSTQRREQ